MMAGMESAQGGTKLEAYGDVDCVVIHAEAHRGDVHGVQPSTKHQLP